MVFSMLWQKLKGALKESLADADYSLWINPLVCVRQDDEVLELACPDRYFSVWLRDKFLPVMQSCLRDTCEARQRIELVVDSGGRVLETRAPKPAEQLRFPTMPVATSFVRNLHPRYTFDEFMVGDCNQLAQTACQSLARGDLSYGQTVYVNASTGLGKSHLTHAVAHDIINHAPGTRLHYLTLQQFSSEMVANIKANAMDAFKEKYSRGCDMLLIEDVHSLNGKKKTQAELSEILDFLLKSGKRVIFTGAQGPRDILNIDDSVRSRMAAGLITTINPPDFETRMKIIRRKALNCNLPLSDDLISYLARHLRGDIRQVESAIVGLKAKSSLLRSAPSLAMAREIVQSIVGTASDLSIDRIREFVADQFKVTVQDLQSRSRKKHIAFPRQVSMYLARKLTEEPLTGIGRAFNRDHSTVLHSIKVVTEAMARNSSVRGQVDLLAAKLKK